MNRLTLLRRERGLTQVALAQQLGIWQPLISALERGKKTPERITDRTRKGLEEFFGRPLENLLERLVA